MKGPTVMPDFTGCRALVVGDAILDVYEKGVTEKLCREAPAPVVALKEKTFSCGGAANAAVNMAALGANVRLLTVIGNDAHGDDLLRALDAGNVDTRHVIRAAGRSTITKTRICASSSILVRVDEGNTDPISDALAKSAARAIHENLEGFDVVVLSDYGYGLFTDAFLDALGRLFKNLQAALVVDARHPARFRALHPTIIKPNYDETLELLNLPRLLRSARIEQVLDNGDALLEKSGAAMVAATLDMEGTILFEHGQRPYLISCLPQEEKKTIGAGDSFVSALALSLAYGMSPKDAARIGAAAAAVVIGKDGTGICSREDLQAHFHGPDKLARTPEILAERINEAREHGQRVVFTNGCFDILHRGHVDFLAQAKALGDVLVVALNSDASIQHLKGDNRPVNRLEDRMQVLAGLAAVDILVSFDADSPAEILTTVRPDVFAKGGTYSVDSLPEAALVRELGGEVEIIPFRNPLSTSRLIERIQQSGVRPSVHGEQRAL